MNDHAFQLFTKHVFFIMDSWTLKTYVAKSLRTLVGKTVNTVRMFTLIYEF